MLVSIHDKHNIKMMNMTLVFHREHPHERKKEAESAQNGDTLKLNFSTILKSIPTKQEMRIMILYY